MTFTQQAVQLSGRTALLLGWRPAEFWNATPTELLAIIAAFRADGEAADSDTLSELLKQYPDAPTGGE